MLKAQRRVFHDPMPFAPPIDAQLVFGFCCLGGEHKQMNLHAAMELMNVEVDVAAHRAVNDAECHGGTAAQCGWGGDGARPERRMQHDILEKESRVAASALRSLPTPYMFQTDALADQRLMSLPCSRLRQANRV